MGLSHMLADLNAEDEEEKEEEEALSDSEVLCWGGKRPVDELAGRP